MCVTFLAYLLFYSNILFQKKIPFYWKPKCKISTNFSKISDSLNKADLGKTVANLQKTLEKVDKMMGDLQAGKGSMGKLIKDEALYNNLEKHLNNLEGTVSQDFRHCFAFILSGPLMNWLEQFC